MKRTDTPMLTETLRPLECLSCPVCILGLDKSGIRTLVPYLLSPTSYDWIANNDFIAS